MLEQCLYIYVYTKRTFLSLICVLVLFLYLISNIYRNDVHVHDLI